jgi:hypothetical protein
MRGGAALAPYLVREGAMQTQSISRNLPAIPAHAFRAPRTVREFCTHWHMGRSKFYGLVNAGTIRLTKCGSCSLIMPDDEDAFAARLAGGKEALYQAKA